MKIALLLPNKISWFGPARGFLYKKVLEDAGYTTTLIPLNRNKCPIKLGDYKIVFNHALHVDPKKIRRLALQFPNTKFVHVNHSSIAHLEITRNSRYINRLSECIYTAKQLKNVFVANVDPRGLSQSLDLDRAIYLPCPLHQPTTKDYKPIRGNANIVIAGRVDPVKNYFNQILALGMLSKQVTIHFCLDKKPDWIINILKALGLAGKFHGMLPHDQWIKFLLNTADVSLQCSLSESHNNVAVECMQCGVPTITGPAISFGDKELRVDPNNPETITEKTMVAIANHHLYSERAKHIGSVVAQTSINNYLDIVQNLTKETN